MPAVTFDAALFKARYPEFTAVPDATLQAYFLEAGMYLSNTDKPVVNEQRRLILFNMLVAHIAFMGGALSADKMARPVGRVSNAAEGSVSAAFDYFTATPGSGAWFNQSQYGAAFFQATSGLRTMRYVPCQTIY